MFKTKKFWYILLFAILYLIVAFSSFYHAVAFFGLANNLWMSVILAFAFEIGQAAVLFSLLTSAKDRSRIMPWVLMTMFTLVQVIGNVFSSYKHIMLNSVENLKYFKEPIFIWTNLPDQEATVIVTYIIGALLPIAALLLTSMITNYLNDEEEKQNDEPIKETLVKDQQQLKDDQKLVYSQKEDEQSEIEEKIERTENNNENSKDIQKEQLALEETKNVEDQSSEEIIENKDIKKPKEIKDNKILKQAEDMILGQTIGNSEQRKSHFINL